MLRRELEQTYIKRSILCSQTTSSSVQNYERPNYKGNYILELKIIKEDDSQTLGKPKTRKQLDNRLKTELFKYNYETFKRGCLVYLKKSCRGKTSVS